MARLIIMLLGLSTLMAAPAHARSCSTDQIKRGCHTELGDIVPEWPHGRPECVCPGSLNVVSTESPRGDNKAETINRTLRCEESASSENGKFVTETTFRGRAVEYFKTFILMPDGSETDSFDLYRFKGFLGPGTDHLHLYAFTRFEDRRVVLDFRDTNDSRNVIDFSGPNLRYYLSDELVRSGPMTCRDI